MRMRGLHRLKMAMMLRAVGVYKHMTLGARCAVFDDGKVLLVRHTYAPGWQFPGGGVDPGETAQAAVRREVLEETGFAVTGPVRMVALYHNTHYTNRDHVAFFHAEGCERERRFEPGREIAEIGWFSPSGLPGTVAGSVRRRLGELAGRSEIAALW